MKKAATAISAIAIIAIMSGCSEKTKPLPFVMASEGVLIESNSRDASAEAGKILQFTTIEPVLYDVLYCIKGPSHIRVKKSGSLQGAFDDLVDAGWDCVLIED